MPCRPDVTALHETIGALMAERDNERAEAQAEIDRLRNLVKVLQRSQFGRRSERLDQDQLNLGLEDLDADVAQAEAALPAISTEKEQTEPVDKERLSLPDHLEREDVTLDIEAEACPCCGGAIHQMARR
jgi:transposase